MGNNGKVAIVTGASRGIGLAIAGRLNENKITVVMTGRNKDPLEQAAASLNTDNAPVLAVQADSGNPQHVEHLMGTVMEKFGRMDILVNNAGVIRDRIICSTSLEDWDHVIGINLTGPFLCTRSAAKEMMLNKFGRIINISSIAARGGGAGQAAYASSKAGLEAFTRIAAVELGRKNITVNAIAPGAIETDMTEALIQKNSGTLLKRIPARRLGTPDDIAGAVMFLISDEGAYITGQVLSVTGGLGLTYKN